MANWLPVHRTGIVGLKVLAPIRAWGVAVRADLCRVPARILAYHFLVDAPPNPQLAEAITEVGRSREGPHSCGPFSPLCL